MAQYEERRQVSSMICQILKSIILKTERSGRYKETKTKQEKSPFSLSCIPEISIEEYLSRLVFSLRIERATLIAALIYVDRVCTEGNIALTMYNVHSIILISIIISLKYNEDKCFKLKYYAKVGGMRRKKIAQLEADFLKMVQYNLYVDESLYFRYSKFINN